MAYRHVDLDEEAQSFQGLPVEAQDALLAARKARRLEEKRPFELFDDWLLRQAARPELHASWPSSPWL